MAAEWQSGMVVVDYSDALLAVRVGGGGLMHSGDLNDDIVFGKVYDQKVVGRFAGYLKKYKASAIIASVSMVISTLTTLFMPLLFSDAINIVQTCDASTMDPIVRYFIRIFNVQGNSHILTAIFIIFIVDGLIAWGSQYIQQYTMANIGYGIILDSASTDVRPSCKNCRLVSMTATKWDVLCLASKTMSAHLKTF